MKTLLLGLLFAAATAALGQPAALVDGVQMPAWRERDGTRLPLVPGMELRAGDRVVSGKDARVLVRLAEGSVVKLGENGTLRIAELEPGRGLFKAALEVLQGAFRFTTDVVQKDRKRDVKVRVGQVTAGVRGTDFWGRSRDEREIVCLIDGGLEVAAEGEQALRLDKPLQFYQREKGRTQPIGLVRPEQLAQWAQETEIQAAKPALRAGGKFAAQLAAAESRDAAHAIRDRVRAAGYPAEVASRKDGDKVVYAVRIRHLPSRAQAQALANELKGQFGL